jgi:hypothetical protein
MTDPQRLKDEYAGDLHGQLLHSVDADAPRGDARHRTLVALGLGSATLGVPAATTAAAATKVGTSVTVVAVAKWVGVGVGAALLTTGAVQQGSRMLERHQAPAIVAPAEQKAPSTSIAPAVPAQTSASPLADAPDTAALPSTAPTVSPSRTVRAAPSTVKDVAADPTPAAQPIDAPEPAGLSREVAMLDTARQMVSRDPAGTLQTLDDYEKQFPHGDLAPEALVLRIEALVRSGQRPVAQRLGNDYLARNPGSPHARKIASLIGGSPGPTR